MRYIMENAVLRVEADSLGGELQSVRKDGGEYLWQGDPDFWRQKAPNLFPYIARLTGGKYVLNGETRKLPIHGFVNTSELTAEEQEPERLVFRLDADERTRACYPFEFIYRIIYELRGETLHITYQVDNHGTEEMYFGIGGHPGFCLPLGQKETDGKEAGAQEYMPAFEEYYLEFIKETAKETEYAKDPVRIGFSDTCFLTGEDRPYPLEDGKRIRLHHDLFDHDAIVLKNTPKTVAIRSEKSSRAVQVTCPDMPYIGFWHAVKKPAPYVCIEPWSSLPSRQDVVEDLALQPGLVHLPAGGRYRNEWQITFL